MISFIREILGKRDLIRELVIKDLKLRYSRPGLGFLWALISPLLTVAVFYVIFALLLRVEIKEAPFILYLMSAIFPWRFFSDSLMSSATCLIDNKNLIKESGFKHYLIPLSIVLANGINFLPSLAILVIMAAILLKGLTVFILLLPLVLAAHFIVAAGIALAVSVLYVKCRDVRHILEAGLQVLFYSTPVFYSLRLIKDSFGPFWFGIYANNPFVGILNLYRLSILKPFYPSLKGELTMLNLALAPLLLAGVSLLSGLYIYIKNKNSINDYLSY